MTQRWLPGYLTWIRWHLATRLYVGTLSDTVVDSTLYSKLRNNFNKGTKMTHYLAILIMPIECSLQNNVNGVVSYNLTVCMYVYIYIYYIGREPLCNPFVILYTYICVCVCLYEKDNI